MTDKTLYTVTIFSENTVGLLGQVTSVFIRRFLNIETLSVSQSAIKGIHKFTITVFSDKETIEKVVRQIDKSVDVLKTYYNTDDELIHQEIALYKLPTPDFLKIGSVEKLIRKHNAQILEINEICVVIQKTGHYADSQSLFDELSENIKVLQFIRSGRIAVNTSKTERLSDMLAEIDKRNGHEENN
ncbi:MAG: acetolactate synthase small subunit [Flavobacteriaceae bacterium]|jgi:acetolactate synthase-1/3 small subunit|nr:acetolactate synthase small subunit [Flavobacteriaceae bacterium]